MQTETETVFTSPPASAGFFYSYDLMDALTDAIEAADADSDEVCHWLELDDGRSVKSVRVDKETLTDGSVACKIILVIGD